MSESEKKLAVAVAGICGRMGMETAAAVVDHPRLDLRLGVERDGHPRAGGVLRFESTGGEAPAVEVPVAEDSSVDLSEVQVLADFSSADAARRYASLCAGAGVAYVCGVTGVPDSGMEAIRRAGERVAVVYSPNMSAGVNLLAWLVEETARRMAMGYDVEIIETHHKAKVDVPSGTAAMLAERVARASGVDAREVVISRPAGMGARKEGDITVHSLRGGDVVGEHEVKFIGMGETLTLSHRAHSRAAFARGVPRAIEFAGSAPPGFYTMKDVLL